MGAASLLFCREIWENSERFNFYPFIKMLFTFSILVILINHFIGSFFIDNHRDFCIYEYDNTFNYFLCRNRKTYFDVSYCHSSFYSARALNGVFNFVSNFPRKIWRYVHNCPDIYLLFSCVWLHRKIPKKRYGIIYNRHITWHFFSIFPCCNKSNFFYLILNLFEKWRG